ncbi:MAG: hypothetical protein NW200_04815 [Hyphomonadaceae bacterium]|nr:hypothetical protein [Hyphomonadaceae bacterium]
MVAWNSPEPGVRLDESQGAVALATWCQACRRGGRSIPIAEAMARLGPTARFRDVAQRLRCDRCGARRGEVRVEIDPQAWAKRTRLP